MGEIAEAMLDGTFCQSCGEVLIEPGEDSPGYPRTCAACRANSIEAEQHGEPEYLDEHAVWAAQREQSMAKRRRNLRQSTELLRARGIKFEAKNNGVHLIVRHADRVFDFWPSTGKWSERDRAIVPQMVAFARAPKKSGRGVFNLLRELEKPATP